MIKWRKLHCVTGKDLIPPPTASNHVSLLEMPQFKLKKIIIVGRVMVTQAR